MKKMKLKIGELQFLILRILWNSKIPLKAYEIHDVLKEIYGKEKYSCTWMSLQLLCKRDLASVNSRRYSITPMGAIEYLRRIWPCGLKGKRTLLYNVS